MLQPVLKNMDRVFRQNRELAKRNDSLNIRLNETSAKNEKLEAEKNKRSTLEKGGKSGFKPKDTAVPLIEAEVYETTTVLTGNRVKLRLLEEAWLNGVKIPVNTFLYGICEVSNERLQIEVMQIPVGEKFIPVQVTVCDLDGLPGLYVPDNASRKVAKEVGSKCQYFLHVRGKQQSADLYGNAGSRPDSPISAKNDPNQKSHHQKKYPRLFNQQKQITMKSILILITCALIQFSVSAQNILKISDSKNQSSGLPR